MKLWKTTGLWRHCLLATLFVLLPSAAKANALGITASFTTKVTIELVDGTQIELTGPTGLELKEKLASLPPGSIKSLVIKGHGDERGGLLRDDQNMLTVLNQGDLGVNVYVSVPGPDGEDPHDITGLICNATNRDSTIDLNWCKSAPVAKLLALAVPNVAVRGNDYSVPFQTVRVSTSTYETTNNSGLFTFQSDWQMNGQPTCLDVDLNNWLDQVARKTKVKVCNGNERQQFYWIEMPSGFGQIRSVGENGKCLDANDDATTPDEPSTTYFRDCHNGDNQLWWYDQTTRRLSNKQYGNKCLDVSQSPDGNAGEDGKRVYLYPCHDGDNQKWTSVPL